MPTYEYVCSNCANQWEEMQKISEPALEDCPKCHEHTAKRQISGGRFILKGGGWYADLYSSTKPGKKDDSKGSATATDSKAASGSGGSGDSASSSSTGSSESSGSSGSSSGGSTGASTSTPSATPSSSAPTTR